MKVAPQDNPYKSDNGQVVVDEYSILVYFCPRLFHVFNIPAKSESNDHVLPSVPRKMHFQTAFYKIEDLSS